MEYLLTHKITGFQERIKIHDNDHPLNKLFDMGYFDGLGLKYYCVEKDPEFFEIWMYRNIETIEQDRWVMFTVEKL